MATPSTQLGRDIAGALDVPLPEVRQRADGRTEIVLRRSDLHRLLVALGRQHGATSAAGPQTSDTQRTLALLRVLVPVLTDAERAQVRAAAGARSSLRRIA